MNPHVRQPARARSYPLDCWYVVATGDEVTHAAPLGRRALDTGLVLFRTSDGTVVVLEDRDAHKPFPLSLGTIVDDCIVSAYSGFGYAADGTCVRVPTQVEIPYGAQVRRFPVREHDGWVWVWFGEPGTADLRRPHRTPWLEDDSWTTLGEAWDTSADYLLLHENFADITHVAVVDPQIAPPVLSAGPVPLLEVEVSETSVAFRRDYPPATLAPWQARLVGVEPGATFAQREQGRFVSPGLWVDSWDVLRDDGQEPWTFRFTHAVTPVDARTTRHVWRVSRNYAPGAQASATLLPLFTHYYRTVQSILETMQRVLDVDGPRPDVHVAADAAALHVRRIVARMVAEERSN